MVSELYDIGDVVSIFSLKKHKGLSGKECFFANSIENVIEYANYGYNSSLLILVSYEDKTFLATDGKYYKYLIPKKNKDITFSPFRTAEEFIREVKKRSKLFHGLDGNMLPAIWVRNIKTDFITSIICINTDSDLIGEVHLTNHYIIAFSELLSEYVFFDGTPCGMIIGNEEDIECPRECL